MITSITSHLTYLVQIIFVFVRISFTQGNRHDFIFAEKEPVEEDTKKSLR